MVKKTARYKKPAKQQQRILFYVFIGVLSSAMVFTIRNNQSQLTCANSNSCTSDLSEQIEQNATGMFQGHRVSSPNIDPQLDLDPSSVLGESTASGEKHIYIDIATQTLYAYQGPTLLLKTFISAGKWHNTPVGNFHIWEKLRATRMSGGEGAAAYDLPNVPYVMYFYHDFGLHGAYWHDNFGHAMSHGCVNMRSVDANIVYDWADGPANSLPGTPVSVCDQITDTNQCIQNNPVQ